MITMISLVLWTAFGAWFIRNNEGGWLMMLTDRRNIRNTWVAIPSLVICWVLWPWKDLSRQIFRFMYKNNF